MSILITICARGGSKGIPGKNIKHLNGQPLIAYSIATAKKFLQKQAGVLALSTDAATIREVAADYGLHTNYHRPARLAQDTSGKIAVIEHLKNFEETSRNIQFDFIIDLDITSPLRTVEDLQQALAKLRAHPDAHNIFSVSPAHRNPYFNMVELGKDGFVRLVKQGKTILSRQSAPLVFDMNASFYIYRPSFFNSSSQISVTEKSLHYLIPHPCFDLDTPQDFTVMELMMQNDLLGFDL